MKKVQMISVFCFILLLGGFTVWSFVTPVKSYSDMENRELAQAPELTGTSVLSGNYQKEYETYLADQIFLRDKWVNGYANMERVLGKKEINGVYVGGDGYLIEKYEEEDFDREGDEEKIKILSGFLDTASEVLGEEHVSCLFVPSKSDVLAGKMPDFAPKYSGKATVDRVAEKTKNRGCVVNLQEALSKHREEYIYYRTDHHWTTLGAYYGFCELAKRNRWEVPELAEYRQEVVFDDFLGTTYNKAHVSVTPDEVRLFHRGDEGVKVNGNNGEFTSDSFYFKEAAEKGFDRYQVFFSRNTGKIEVTTGSKTGKTLLLIKDSFANCFVPFLAPYYDKIILTDCRYSRAKIGMRWKEYPDITDVLVLFNVEKFRQGTSLSPLKVSKRDLKKGKAEKKPESEEEDDIFKDLISLD